MSQWICEDVGLFINELREKYSDKLNELDYKEGEEMNEKTEGIIKGFNLAYDILDELADMWTCDDPPEEVKSKLKKHYGDLV